MSLTSKSPQDLARAALDMAMDALPLYSHRNSPKTFTQPQLFACLVLKSFFRTDYRGISEYLRDMPALVEILALDHVPHFTTLQKASARLLKVAPVRKLLAASIRTYRAGANKRKARIALAAMDSSGFACGHISSYFVKRRSREKNLWQTTQYTRFAKLEVICDTATHLILGCHSGRGPAPDANRFVPLLEEGLLSENIERALADAGYDSESNHQYARETRHVRTLIPAEVGRPTKKPPRGKYRRLMKRLLSTKRKRRRSGYGQRWQEETVFSMIKRRQSDSVAGRTYQSQCRDLRLLVVTHNAMIVLCLLFYRAIQTGIVARRAGYR